MRVIVPLIALLLTTGAAAPQAVPLEPTPGAMTAQVDLGAVCRDRIQQVRQERGLPQLQRDTASLDEGLLISAVDKRIGGCSMMVMHGNANDVRPLPAPREHQLMRAR